MLKACWDLTFELQNEGFYFKPGCRRSKAHFEVNSSAISRKIAEILELKTIF